MAKTDEESALVGGFKILAGVVAAACVIGAVITHFASEGRTPGTALLVVVAGFVGWLSLYTMARVLRVLEEIRDAAVRAAPPAKEKEKAAWRYFVLAAALALAACSSGPDPEAPDPITPEPIASPAMYPYLTLDCGDACAGYGYDTGDWCDCLFPPPGQCDDNGCMIGVTVCVCRDQRQGAANACEIICSQFP